MYPAKYNDSQYFQQYIICITNEYRITYCITMNIINSHCNTIYERNEDTFEL